MSTVSRYVSRLLFIHLALMLVGFVALLQLLDLLNNADDITEKHGSGIAALVKYAALRLPDTVSFILPFSVLIAALLTLARLARHNEVLALKAGGMSFYRLLLNLMPAVLVIGLLHFLLSDQLVPASARALQEWDASTGVDLGTGSDDPAGMWARDGTTFVHVRSVSAGGTELRDLTLFKRNDRAVLTERITARRAVHDGRLWQLFDVRTLSLADGQDGNEVSDPEGQWATALTPGHFADLAADPGTLSFGDVWRFAMNPDVGSRPADFYRTWLQHKLALPLTSLLMVLLAAPVAQGLQRHGGMAAGLAAGVGLGFLYFVAEGLLLTLGETGAIAPVIAAWGPAILFGAVGAIALLRIEGY